MLITADGGYRRGDVFPLKPAADEAIASAATIEHVVVVRRGGNDVEMKAGRDHWYHDLIAAADPVCPAEPMDSEQLLFLLYTSGTTGQAEGHHAHQRRLPHAGRVHPQVRVRPAPRHRRVLVHRRRRLGHRPQLHRLRPAGQRGNQRDVRRRAQLPGQRSAVVDHREVQGHQVLYGADRDPHVHEVGGRRSRPSTTCRRCGCSDRSANRSTPKRGCGTARTSAAEHARWSTPGGRPRPAGS